MFCQVHAQSNGIHIELIGPEQGLPNRNIKCISQDTIGFIWIGTSTELLRYDGYHFENFTYLLDEKNTSSIIINDIKSDRKGYLWIAHANGITVIDPHTLSSRQVTIQKKFPGKLKAPFAMRIFFDRKGYTWASFASGIFIKLDENLNPLVLYSASDSRNNPLLKGFFGTAVLSDSAGNLYLYTNKNFIDVLSESGNFKRRILLPEYKYNKMKFFPEFIRYKADDKIEVQYTSYNLTQTIFVDCVIKDTAETFTFS